MSIGFVLLVGMLIWAFVATMVALGVGRAAKARDAGPATGGPGSSRPRSRDTVLDLTREDDDATRPRD